MRAMTLVVSSTIEVTTASYKIATAHIRTWRCTASEIVVCGSDTRVEHENGYTDSCMATLVCADAVQTPSHGLNADLKIGDLEHLMIKLDIPHGITSGNSRGGSTSSSN